jgi:hypothetical protein
MKQAYQHPFEKIDESVYTDKPWIKSVF